MLKKNIEILEKVQRRFTKAHSRIETFNILSEASRIKTGQSRTLACLS